MIKVKLKPEFASDYPEIDPDIWYEVVMTVLDRVCLTNTMHGGPLYLRRKFDVEEVR
jgi:hypothetical protein